jgi:hypothetical protein
MYNTEEYFSVYGHGLGLSLDPVSSVIGGISSIFGGSNPKDPGRIAANTRAFNQAISGNDGVFYSAEGTVADPLGGLHFLKVHSVMNDADGGWATKVATDDAMKKYKQAQQILASKGLPTTPPSTASNYPQTPTPMTGPVIAGLSTGPLLIAGVAALGIFALTRSRSRR